MTDARTYVGLLTTGPAGSALESAGGNRAHTARSELVERLDAEIAYVERKTGVSVDPYGWRALLGKADDALAKLFGDGPDARLGRDDVGGLEAVIATDGSRPVLFVEDDFVDVRAPSIGDYAAPLSRLEDAVRAVCRSVGRVDDPAAQPLGYQGTAWAVAEGIVVTNYHVLRAVAPSAVRRDGRFEGRLNPGVAVHFGHEVRDVRQDRRFPVRRVIAVGQQGADEHVHPELPNLNFDGLDLAVLELEPVPGRPFPAPITVARGDDLRTMGALANAGRGVYVVGYPGNEQSTTPDLFVRLFAGVKSFKRLAPGRIVDAAGQVPHDPRGWVLTHDVSTLGGNSGSAVVDLDADGRTALGLHFAGLHARQNWAHALERTTREVNRMLPELLG
ncbi:trypsin-like serine peptidase [Micromonospora sp. NPDC005806]|uniref:trypsin-like serine peptidase n=1 Tax=Micromonospora sp. NPDC005806 TaxID=3364234 RepID=UPI0036C39A00